MTVVDGVAPGLLATADGKWTPGRIGAHTRSSSSMREVSMSMAFAGGGAMAAMPAALLVVADRCMGARLRCSLERLEAVR